MRREGRGEEGRVPSQKDTNLERRETHYLLSIFSLRNRTISGKQFSTNINFRETATMDLKDLWVFLVRGGGGSEQT